MSTPSVAAWNTLGDGSSAITWACGILSSVQLLKSTFTYIENQSVGGLLRRGREQLKMLLDHAAKLTPQERRLIDSKKPQYLAGVENFITRTDEFLDRVECDYRQGLLHPWKTHGPNMWNDVKKGLLKTESNTEKMRNDLMSTSNGVRGLTGAIAAHVPECPLDGKSSFLDTGHVSHSRRHDELNNSLPLTHRMSPSAVSLPSHCATRYCSEGRGSTSTFYTGTSTSGSTCPPAHHHYQS